jgi:NADP-dependent 3-hydroxy acid dehydrogenase YdfG
MSCRNVVVTGAASGIGEGIARSLAASGHSLVLADLNEAKLTELAQELGNATPVTVDVSDPSSGDKLRTVAENAGKRFGASERCGYIPGEAFSTQF